MKWDLLSTFELNSGCLKICHIWCFDSISFFYVSGCSKQRVNSFFVIHFSQAASKKNHLCSQLHKPALNIFTIKAFVVVFFTYRRTMIIILRCILKLRLAN